MELRIIIGGQAGQGILKASDILSKAFVKLGYYVFNYRYYQSRIRGGHNYNSLKISDKPVFCHEEENIDFLIALDQYTVNFHKNKLSKDGYIITDKSINADRKIEVDINGILSKANLSQKSSNIVLLSVLWKILGYDKEILKSVISKELNEEQAKITDIVYESFNISIKRKNGEKRSSNKKLYYISGSDAIAYGAIAAGLDVYIAYPMTPSTQVLHILAKVKDKYGILVYQPDNEIGAINMAIGASFAGAKAMVGTSGGGFALMTEALSMAGMAEIPIVIYLAQRGTPSTGLPTYTMQADLKFALNAGHGEFPKIVIAPGDPKEAFIRTVEAFYLSYKYRVPTIILSDTFLAESKVTYSDLPSLKVSPKRNIDLRTIDGIFPYYKITENGVSPTSIPGINYVKANSYEHDEYGFTTEEAEISSKMQEKRLRKMKYINEEIKKLQPYELYGSGKNLLIGWGSTKLPVLEALKYIDNWAYLHISYISPFPEEIKDIIDKFEKVVLIEENVTGLLGKVIRENTGILIEDKILKYDGRPFTGKYIIEKIKNI